MTYEELKEGLYIGMPNTNAEVRAAWCHLKAREYELMAEQALAQEGKANRKFNEIQFDLSIIQQDMEGFRIMHSEQEIWLMTYGK